MERVYELKVVSKQNVEVFRELYTTREACEDRANQHANTELNWYTIPDSPSSWCSDLSDTHLYYINMQVVTPHYNGYFHKVTINNEVYYVELLQEYLSIVPIRYILQTEYKEEDGTGEFNCSICQIAYNDIPSRAVITRIYSSKTNDNTKKYTKEPLKETNVKVTMDSVKPGQIWIAADGGNYGHLVCDIDSVKQDAIVRQFNSANFEYAETRARIDLFKITYRYSLPVRVPDWVPGVVIRASNEVRNGI